MTGFSVETWELSRIKPYPKNARKIPDKAIEKVMQSLRQFGWRQPIVVDGAGVIIVGHTRFEAAKRLGWTTAPVHVGSDLSAAQVRAYRLADNRTHDESDWDMDILAAEMKDLAAMAADLSSTAFDGIQIDRLLAGATEADEKANAGVPLPEHPETKLGDVWILGRHRLVCGDCTEIDTATLALLGERPRLMVTDPPYGVSYDPAWRDELPTQRAPNKQTGLVANDGRSDWTPAWKLFPGDVAYVWHSSLHGGVVEASLRAARFELRSQIIWRKQQAAMSRGAHEPCYYAVRKARQAQNNN